MTRVKEGGKIDQHLDLIAGLPEEDYDSFKKTFNDVFAFRPEELQLGFLKMLRGTGLRLRAEEHQYIFSEHTPYEILGNRVMPFDDIIRIKQVEDVLEKYWNDHRMDHTIEYLVSKAFPSPFDFFQDFGSFWENRGWSRIGHQLEDLFRRLNDFLQFTQIQDYSIVIDLMKYDYLSNQKYKPRKSWWEAALTKQERSKIYQTILQNPSLIDGLNLEEKELYKHTLLEPISFNIGQYFINGIIDKTPSLMFFYFDPACEKPIFKTIKQDHLQLLNQ